MTSSWHRWSLAGLILIVVLGTGCNMMSLPFFLMPGMEPKSEPKCRLASDDKEKKVKVLILASRGLETRPEFVNVDRDLSRLLTLQLQEGFKNNKENVSVMSPSRVENYKDRHSNWRSMSPEEIGETFRGGDKTSSWYVINIEIDSISLYEQGSANQLFHGRADLSLDVVDLNKPGEGPIYRESCTVEYPKVSGPIAASDSNVLQFRQRFLNVVARELSWRFTSHLLDDDHRVE
jgi:hypothetical protein